MMDVWLTDLGTAFGAALLGAVVAVTLLVAKSLRDFTRAGPKIRSEIVENFSGYTAYATARQALWAGLVTLYLEVSGATLYLGTVWVFGSEPTLGAALSAGLGSAVVLGGFQFCQRLLYAPSSIAASFQYRLSRLYPLWRCLSPLRLKTAGYLLAGLGALFTAVIITALSVEASPAQALMVAAVIAAWLGVLATAVRPPRSAIRRAPPRGRDVGRPNIVMLETDTLRADRVTPGRYHRLLTPHIHNLMQRGTYFENCFVPLARTGPSLTSLFTGAWPHSHGIRSNYVSDEQTPLQVATLPKCLSAAGYRTGAITDWAGSDLGKLGFGFDHYSGPDDQWNLKQYIKQGPMDLRLFLSLFTSNRFGRRFLPELYYLSGVPLTTRLEGEFYELVEKWAQDDAPFMLNLFTGATHVPFGSDYPYYLQFSDPAYDGEAKFVMARLNEPEEIIRKQEAPSDAFDIPQIANLYDGCVKSFDDLVGRITDSLRNAGLAENTVIVLYSDHGLDFFENETWGQGNTVFGDDPGSRIPVVFADPNATSHRCVREVVRSIDVMPTLLSLVGLPPSGTGDGVSLADTVRDGEPPPNLDAFGETGLWLGRIRGMDPEHVTYPGLFELLEIKDRRTGTLSIKEEYQPVIAAAKDRMIRRGHWKLIRVALRQGPRYQLYNVEQDPLCKRDLALEYPGVVAELAARLDEWTARDRLVTRASTEEGLSPTELEYGMGVQGSAT